MSVIVCLYVGTPSPYLSEPIGGAGTRERVVRFVSTLPDVTRVAVFVSGGVNGLPDDWRIVDRPSWTVADLVASMADQVTKPEDVILFAHLDQPFLNSELTSRLLARHERFSADYTFADGYPQGLAPELLRGRAMDTIRTMAEEANGPVERTSMFTVLQRDMNRFDVETELSARDQRLLRLVLAVDTLANVLVCQGLAPNAPDSIDEWPDHVEKDRAAHRTLPRYVSIQVLEQEVHEVSYSPYPLTHASVLGPGAIMSAERFDSIIEDLHSFSPEAIVNISLWGELALHPAVRRLIHSVTSRPPLKLLVETSGVGWRAEDREELFSADRTSIIIGLDALNEKLYREIRGEGFAEAVDFAEEALRQKPAESYVQAVRCDLTEPGLDEFYRHWSERTQNVIVQKYDWFSGKLPERALSDLAPVKRFACWHMQRDMSILVDGTVPRCREDLEKTSVLGNVFENGLQAVWGTGLSEYKHQLAGEYRGVCENCDEYYTFNF